MKTHHAKTVILGAGAMGLATAYHLARRGEPFTLVEQFAIGHDRGSSHGSARITRHSYADARYARLMPAAFAAWRALEADAGIPLYIRTGGVSLSSPGVDYVARVAASLDSIQCPHRVMNGRELRTVMPVFAGVPDDHAALFEPDAGMLLAERALSAMRNLSQTLGGPRSTFLENAPVRRIDMAADRPTLIFDRATLTADRLIVTAGPWIGALFPEFAPGLRPERQQVLYFSPEDMAPFAIGRMPVFISIGASPRDLFYGMPAILNGGIKIARHGGDPIDPYEDNREIGDGYREEIRTFLRSTLPALAEAPITRTEICKYTVAPNEDFLVGPHPDRPDVIVASPCSGHGFKFSALIGRVLADLATTGTTDVDFITSWRNKKRN
jgi:sarcosine oxidase